MYLSGEEIWFQANVNVDYTQKAFSQILYLELFNENQKTITRGKYRIQEGVTQGILNIPSEFLSGSYFLRAYTQYNKNFASENFFLSAIQIINPQTGLTTNKILSATDFIIYQDNNEASNKTSKTISFSIPKNFLKTNEKPILYIDSVEQNNAVLLKNGWGMINLKTFEKNTTNSLILINVKGDTLEKELVLEERSSFSVNASVSITGHHIVTILPPQNSKINNSSIYTLELVNSQLQIQSSIEFPLSNSETQLVIPNSNILKSGLYFFILKNEKKEILKVFAFNSENNDSESKRIAKSKTYKRRDLLKINLNEVTNENMVNIGVKAIPKGTILSTLNKLKFYLDNPNLLFSYIKNQLDLSTLTSEESAVFLNILNSKLDDTEFIKLFYPAKAKEFKWIPEIRDIGLSGYIVNKKTQEAAPKIPVYLSVFRDFPQIHIYESRDDGSFIFSLNNFENDQDVFLCPLSNKADELELKVNIDFEVDFPLLNKIALTVDSSDTKLLEQMLIASQTPKAYNIIPKEKDLSIRHLPYSFENPQLSIVLDDYIETPTMEMVFKELVPNVKVRKKNNKYRLSIFDTEQELFYNDPLILVDDVPIFNLDELFRTAKNLPSTRCPISPV